ncbi:lactoylglutathione lyase [Sarocladium strictum]
MPDVTAKYPPKGKVLQGGTEPQEALTDTDPTNGYRFNHVMIRIKDPEATLNFYCKLMGMRVIWVLNTGPFTGYYLGYPQTPEHRADPLKFAQDTSLHSTLCSTAGLLELCHYHGSEHLPGQYVNPGHRPPHVGFHHLGFTVPDVKATVQRLKAAGVKVFKDVGVEETDDFPVTKWDRHVKGLANDDDLDLKFLKLQAQFAFVEDPDGYLVEIVPQTLVLP